MIVDIECLANPLGTDENPYQHVEAAIKVIQDSGLKHEVNALGTTVEGEPDELWALVRKVHEACLASGPKGLVTIIKVEQAGPNQPQPTIDGLTAKFRS